MKIGDKVIAKIDVPGYRIKEGDRGMIIEVKDHLGSGSYLSCRWQDGHLDMGWWIDPNPPVDKSLTPNLIANLEIEISLPDTRDYLEAIAGLAVQL